MLAALFFTVEVKRYNAQRIMDVKIRILVSDLFYTYSTADIPLIHQLDVSTFAYAIPVSFPDPLEVGSGDETSAIHLCIGSS